MRYLLIITLMLAFFVGSLFVVSINSEPTVETEYIPIIIEMPTHINVKINAELPFETLEVTAYTAGVESTGKTPSHPLYGVTASGEYVEDWHTIACPPSVPFGTAVYIPHFSEEENGGVFECTDRGGAITAGRLDVYIEDLDEALRFGRRELDVLIINDEEAVE